MSWSPCPDPTLGDRVSTDAIETLIVPRAVDLGEMTVRRALRYGGRSRHSGVEVPDTPFAAVFVVEGGRIVDCAEFESQSGCGPTSKPCSRRDADFLIDRFKGCSTPRLGFEFAMPPIARCSSGLAMRIFPIRSRLAISGRL